MIDTIVRGATIHDGTSAPPFVTDLGIVGDRIALIGSLEGRDAHATIDGDGSVLAPGFIDAHSHSDELWLADRRCVGKILQGVTTEIGGNCGTSVAPLSGEALARRRETLKPLGIDVEWDDFASFFALIDRHGLALNVASLAGLGTTRRCIRGDREGRLDDAELARERLLVRSAVEQGAIGVSSGLVYVPSRFAEESELVACAAEARLAGAARYVSHLRDEGDALVPAVDEALAIGLHAEVAVHVSHHKAAGKKNWGKIHASLARLDRARTSGRPVSVDVYPYVASWTELATLLPENALAGGRNATLARLRDPETALALALRLELDHGGTWHDILLTSVLTERGATWTGYRIDEIASAWRCSPARAVLRLLLEEGLEVEAIFFNMDEDDVAAVLGAEFCCVGSDASARAIDGVTARGLPHPRTFGTFPRVFGRYVRGRGTLALGEAIRRMTSLPADLFGIRDRGRIEAGRYADLVLFDPVRIVDTATYTQPYAYPLGIGAVWVNGRLVAREGRVTGALPGRALRGGG